MPKETINSLADAIAKLESFSNVKADHLREHIERDCEDIKSAIESVRPYFEELKVKAEKEAAATKEQVETSVKENPWMALGIVGLLAFIVGIFIGRNKK